MSSKMEHLLKNEEGNYLFPFLWVHGESAETYRKMVQVIYDANIRAFCVEARPHKEFVKNQWWQDMEVILSEAERLGMKVWILDDKHFPTGYANGGVEKASPELHRWHLCRRKVTCKGGKTIKLSLKRYLSPKNHYNLMSYIMLLMANNMRFPKKQKDDKLFSCTAYQADEYIDLTKHIDKGRLSWNVPSGDWTIEIVSLSRNTGMHRNYINMLDKESCRILIDEVYEPHYQHFKERFGTTIAGFFSDEPELGNGDYTKHYNYLGTDQSLPYSHELAKELKCILGPDWRNQIPLLWNNGYNPRETARVRYAYMDCVSRLVEKNFSKQIGEWCNERGVEYIGHVIEDNNQHARTSTSLGHYFRGLKYQNMAGIDDIGGQVQPGGEDLQKRFVFGYINDGEFYHYALGKLGTSLGAINPRMQGRTMCEIFGNYGWSLGVRTQKYLADHFMVRGVNRFIPHAFSSKDYPDKDCPPHFYAQGNNPQYRHFGQLMKYMNRICHLISGGKIVTPLAILYHGEAEWSGKCMLMQKPARILQDNQFDFNFLPSDIFSEREFYQTQIGENLVVNKRVHQILIVPYAQFIPADTEQGIVELMQKGGRVVFIEKLPDGLCQGGSLSEEIKQCPVVSLGNLLDYLDQQNIKDIEITPSDNRVRAMHYIGEQEFFYLFNEGSATYQGKIHIPDKAKACVYDAWNNQILDLKICESQAEVTIEPSKSLIILLNYTGGVTYYIPDTKDVRVRKLTDFKRSICRSIEYPDFSEIEKIGSLDSYHTVDKKFSGYIRYETCAKLDECKTVILEITEAYEGVQVFVNGKSVGIQVVPKFVFDITQYCRHGTNDIVIEVATTLERERGNIKDAAPIGITGEVKIYEYV